MRISVKKIVTALVCATLLFAVYNYFFRDIQQDIDQLEIHFIDVGQGDSALILFPGGRVMLIDGGTRSKGMNVIKYLRERKINKIDYLIATHTHEDHIGGLIDVVYEFEIDKIYMPRATHTSRTYEDLLTAIDKKNASIITARAGVEIINEDILKAELIAPNSESYKNLNDYSAVLLLTYGDTKALFTGDIEKVSEAEILSKGFSIKSDLLKIAHHGSNSSTTDEFLKAVAPEYCVICVGEGNTYGHPTPNTLDKLSGTTVYRTDLHGNIKALSDGNKYTIVTGKE